MWKGDPIIRARLHRRDDGDDPKLAFRDAFPPATLHCVLHLWTALPVQAAWGMFLTKSGANIYPASPAMRARPNG